MTSINHSLTGAIIGLAIGPPLLAIGLAVLSHYVCDVIPHYGPGTPDEVTLKTKAFRNYLKINIVFCFLLVVFLAIDQPEHWLLAAICAFAAAAPDFFSINQYLKLSRSKAWNRGWYVKFAKNIQWFERPIGAVVEVAWFIAALIVMAPFLR